jgi:hypothetical protein
MCENIEWMINDNVQPYAIPLPADAPNNPPPLDAGANFPMNSMRRIRKIM